MSGQLSFIFHQPKQLNISTNLITAFNVCSIWILQDLIGSLLIGRLKIWTLMWSHTGCCMLLVYLTKNYKDAKNIKLEFDWI